MRIRVPVENIADETALVEKARGGDLRAFTALVELHQRRAVGTAYAIVGNFEDARDLAQEAFVKAYQSLKDFRGTSRFYTWFYRILVNACSDHLRRPATRGTVTGWFGRDGDEEAPGERIAGTGPDAGRQTLDRELGAELAKAMGELPLQQRTAFALRYLDGLDLEAVADAMQLSVGAVKAHLWQAAQKVRRGIRLYLQEEAI